MDTAHRTATLRHLPALDGLRGLAILGVLLFHADGVIKGGYLGVDLFFVLSGYLITSLLLAEHAQTGGIALASFWIRRARRLVPALLGMLLFVAFHARFIAAPSALLSLRYDAIATLSYVANWRAIFAEHGYWDLFLAPSPLEHMWSLAIEEQFYIVWPFLVMLLLRKGNARAVFWTAVCGMLLSCVALSLRFDPRETSRAYLGTDTRAAALLAGAALSVVFPPGSPWPSAKSKPARLGKVAGVPGVLGLIALLILLAAWGGLDGTRRLLYRGGLWGTELCALTLIVCCATQTPNVVQKLFSVRPLRMCGTVSYGIYLWHWPIKIALSQGAHLTGARLHIVGTLITFVITLASYVLIEKPIRTYGVRSLGSPWLVVPLSMGIPLGLIVWATRPHAPLAPVAETDFRPSFVPLEVVRYRVLFLGDSTANSLGWSMRLLGAPGLAVDLYGVDNCAMIWDNCGESWPARVKSLQPDATAVFVGGAFLHGFGDDDGEWRSACFPKWHTKFERGLEARVHSLAESATQTWLLTLPYALGKWSGAETHAQVDCINTSIRNVAARSPRARVMEFGEYLCPKGVCMREHKGVNIRVDGIHFSVEGSPDVARWTLETLRQQ
jgi:peptidoglycan/LPS O-acetylase OafA/YrhL